jgi:hypothetical protein
LAPVLLAIRLTGPRINPHSWLLHLVILSFRGEKDTVLHKYGIIHYMVSTNGVPNAKIFDA